MAAQNPKDYSATLQLGRIALLPGPNVDGLDNGSLSRVAWSADGQTLFASGRYTDPTGNLPVLAWDQAGRGTRRAIEAKCAESDNNTTALVSLPAGRLLVAKFNPCFTVLKADGAVLWADRRLAAISVAKRKSFRCRQTGQ
jgi:hypothetical protein